MSKVILFNKPFRVLSQFRAHEDKVTLAHYIDDKSLRLAGRLDFDSEGLLLLTDDGKLAAKITDPKYKNPKTYWVQVEGLPTRESLTQLQEGIRLKDGFTRPAEVCLINEPDTLWKRDPPILVMKPIREEASSISPQLLLKYSSTAPCARAQQDR